MVLYSRVQYSTKHNEHKSSLALERDLGLVQQYGVTYCIQQSEHSSWSLERDSVLVQHYGVTTLLLQRR